MITTVTVIICDKCGRDVGARPHYITYAVGDAPTDSDTTRLELCRICFERIHSTCMAAIHLEVPKA